MNSRAKQILCLPRASEGGNGTRSDLSKSKVRGVKLLLLLPCVMSKPGEESRSAIWRGEQRVETAGHSPLLYLPLPIVPLDLSSFQLETEA